MTNIFTGKIAPNPAIYKYWIDVNENPYGGIIKYYNGTNWSIVNQADGLDEDVVLLINNLRADILSKADKANSLSGYGITDAYTKSQTDSKVSEAISNIVGSAPEALDTLYEIANALNNDEDFAAQVTALIGNKVDKVEGRQLSTNDFTNDYKTLLDELTDATTSKSGLMSSTDKTKIDKIVTNGNGDQYLSNDGTYKTIQTGLQDAPSDGKLYGRKNGQWFEIDTDLTKEELEDLLSYGVEWDVTVSDPDLTRIGNPLLHKQLPILSQLRGCIANGNIINYYLNANDWTKKEDGTPSKLDGTDGTVRVHVPKFYGKSEVDGNKRRVRISTTLIDNSYTEIPEMLIDAYRATLDRTSGEESTYRMASVVNTTANFRGGGNRSEFDDLLETSPYRTDLGKSLTNTSRANARKYARNANSEILIYEYYKWILFWLPVIEYATFYLLKNFNSELTAEGYHLGGLGPGFVSFDYNIWEAYNNNSCVVPCGATNEFGNFSNYKIVNIPEETITIANSKNFSRWSLNNTNATVSKSDSLNITNVKTANADIATRSWAFCGNTVTYNITGLTEGLSIIFYSGNTIATAEQDGNIVVKWGTTELTRSIRASFTGTCDITISVVTAEDFKYTLSAVNNLHVFRYRGFENIYGDIHTMLDGIIINTSSETHTNDTLSDVYVTTNPEYFSDSLNGIKNMLYIGTQAENEAYIRELLIGEKAEIIPIATGGTLNTYITDYNYRSTTKDSPRLLIVGGCANSGSSSGVGCFNSSVVATWTSMTSGFRTYSLI